MRNRVGHPPEHIHKNNKTHVVQGFIKQRLLVLTGQKLSFILLLF